MKLLTKLCYTILILLLILPVSVSGGRPNTEGLRLEQASSIIAYESGRILDPYKEKKYQCEIQRIPKKKVNGKAFDPHKSLLWQFWTADLNYEDVDKERNLKWKIKAQNPQPTDKQCMDLGSVFKEKLDDRRWAVEVSGLKIKKNMYKCNILCINSKVLIVDCESHGGIVILPLSNISVNIIISRMIGGE
jgi:hypothetical protein